MPADAVFDAARRIVPGAAQAIRDAVAEAGGREVFFSGKLDAQGMVVLVRVLARGHEDAVPAIFDGLEPRDVVIHNHPGGDVHPSDADLDLAIVYSHNGHGVYIVDNDARRVYVVIEPFREKDRKRLDPTSLAAVVGPSGPLSEALADYEPRPQQARMLEAVAGAFNEDRISVVEAPTGVGKTIAYLVPAVHWAVHNRERVVVSTRTINLQEQIIQKDIPLLQRCLDIKFGAVLVKGRANYLCPRRLERALSEATLFGDKSEEAALRALAEWASHTSDGSRSDLPFQPPYDLWEKVCSESDTCTPLQCMQARNCFLTEARREIAKADILVVNHHMLFSDLAIKKEVGSFTSAAVLPAFERLIIDEAHHVEDSATEYFGVEATLVGSLALLGRLVRAERGQDRGLLPFLKVKLVKDVPATQMADAETAQALINDRLLPAIVAARENVRETFGALRDVTAAKCGQIGRDIKWRLTRDALEDPELRAVHADSVVPLTEELVDMSKTTRALAELLRDFRPKSEDDTPPFALDIVQLHANSARLKRLADVLTEATSAALAPNTVRWIEIDANRPHIVRVVRCPLDAGQALSEWVYPNLKSVAMTSATLTVNRRFDYMLQRTGLDRLKHPPVDTEALDSPFDFDQQALLCVPDDLPPPPDAAFVTASAEIVGEIVRITRGNAFILFTSFSALNDAAARLEAPMREAGLTPLKQGELPRHQLLERFRNVPGSVLFGTDSFWEGVDVAGEALQCVVLTRLPFRVPTEPIFEARCEAIAEQGGNAFLDYTVPLAVIKFRQGFGRLIRRRTDRGAVVVLDARILTQRYGRQFLNSLPPVRQVTGSSAEVLESLSDFFAVKGGVS